MTDETLFAAALEKQSPGERSAFLDEACASDPAMRQRVEALLRTHEKVGDYLERPAVEQIAAGAIPASDDTAALDPGGRPEPASPRTEPSDDEEDARLDFLQPSTKPGSVGRLGHYEVLEVLGRGGFGIVLKAFDEMLHRVVAIKVMAPRLASTSPARKRFLREARASAAIRHENVVAIYAVEEQPIPYLVMEYIAGQTLQQKLDRTGPLDAPEVLRLGRQIAGGLAAAHAMGLIHRDIKPSNILLESGVEQQVKITDFGLARAADDASLTQSGVIAGTPMYMAPEQARGEVIDQRADLFSLGSVLYVMCSGRPPFRASTMLAVLKRVAEDAPRPIREIIPEVPDWLCAIIARLHAKKPEDRYASAKEVADLLARYLSELHRGNVSSLPPGQATPQRSEPPREGLVPSPVAPRARRSGRRWMAAAAVLLLLLTGLGVTEVAGVTHLAGAAFRRFFPDQAITVGYREVSDGPTLAVAPFDANMAQAFQEAWAHHLGVPVEVENSIGMKLRLVPPGEFLMGSSQEEVDAVLKETAPHLADRVRSEAPPRLVRIGEPFFMGAYEVTVGEFRQFVKATRYRTWAEVSGKGGSHWDNKTNMAVTDPHDVWSNARVAPTNDYPVGFLARSDAQAFCDWLGAMEGLRYVLPDEEQWEFACRAGTTGRWGSGDDPEQVRRFGWFGPDVGATHPVGRKLPNAFGLFDMLGNANELVGNPHSPVVLRGGDAGNSIWTCRSASRFETGEDPWDWWGFRVAVVGDLSKLNPDQPKEKGSRKAPEGPPLAIAPFDAQQGRAHQEAWAKHLGGPVEINNTIGMKLAVIPPGKFLMGSPEDEPDRLAYEGPQHEVVLARPFYMAIHDVTVGQFKAFVKDKAYPTEAERTGEGASVLENGKWGYDPRANWRNPGFEQTDEHPVVCVSWNDAKAFCEWLSEKEGKKYALPTEAQWEYACRAGSRTKFSFGDDDQELTQYAWYWRGANSELKPHPVGEKKPNAWGLYDMHGNVWQWTADRFAADYYRTSPKEDPPGPDTGSNRVMRGGGWYHAPLYCRAAYRHVNFAPSARYSDTGFRVVLLP